MISYLAPLAFDGGLPALALPGMLLAFGIGAIIGNLSSGYLADRIGATRVVVLSLLMSMAICVAIALILKLLPDEIGRPGADRHHAARGASSAGRSRRPRRAASSAMRRKSRICRCR